MLILFQKDFFVVKVLKNKWNIYSKYWSIYWHNLKEDYNFIVPNNLDDKFSIRIKLSKFIFIIHMDTFFSLHKWHDNNNFLMKCRNRISVTSLNFIRFLHWNYILSFKTYQKQTICLLGTCSNWMRELQKK